LNQTNPIDYVEPSLARQPDPRRPAAESAPNIAFNLPARSMARAALGLAGAGANKSDERRRPNPVRLARIV
jgi:hypothetical protein